MTRKQKPKRLPNGRFAAKKLRPLTATDIHNAFIPKTWMSLYVKRVQPMPGIDYFEKAPVDKLFTRIMLHGAHADVTRLAAMLEAFLTKRPIPVIREGEAAIVAAEGRAIVALAREMFNLP